MMQYEMIQDWTDKTWYPNPDTPVLFREKIYSLDYSNFEMTVTQWLCNTKVHVHKKHYSGGSYMCEYDLDFDIDYELLSKVVYTNEDYNADEEGILHRVLEALSV